MSMRRARRAAAKAVTRESLIPWVLATGALIGAAILAGQARAECLAQHVAFEPATPGTAG